MTAAKPNAPFASGAKAPEFTSNAPTLLRPPFPESLQAETFSVSSQLRALFSGR
jgi:hypothetical protein